MKKIFPLVFVLFLIMLYVPRYTLYVAAQYGQYGQPSASYSILIDKMVGKPTQTKGGYTDYDYVDNLSPSDPRFAPGQDVWFKIKVKNTSDDALTAVEVKDYVPLYLLPIEGPGKWDETNRTITWNAGDFAVDEEKIYYIKMRVYDQSLLPADKGLFCVINKVSAKKDDIAYDEDTAQLCLEKQVQEVEKVPSAGPEMGALLLTLNLFGLGVGIKLSRKNIKY